MGHGDYEKLTPETIDALWLRAYSEILPDEKGETCAGFILRAAAHFAAFRISRIERIMTDNHWSYRSSDDVRDAMQALDAKHKFIKALAVGGLVTGG